MADLFLTEPDESPSFIWSAWETNLPSLQDHSRAKLDALSGYIYRYIVDYFCKANYGQDRFRLTLVDGFAGGGVYADQQLGSPFVLLQSVKNAENQLNKSRTKPIKIDCHFYFVESKRSTAACLEFYLKQYGYGDEIGKTIFLIRDKFENAQKKIVEDARRRFKRDGSRLIFFLDQCGYTQVSPRLLKSISEQLNWKAEFIVNFAIDWLIDFISNEDTLRRIYPSLELDEALPIEKILETYSNSHFHKQYVIESLIGPAFQKVTGSNFFSPFYIQSSESKRGYWLVHLASQRQARQAMMDVYWSIANGCCHYGHAGLDMLSYKPDANQTGFFSGLDFSSSTKSLVLNQLSADLPKEIRDKFQTGVTYNQLQDKIADRVMANDKILREALIQAMLSNEIDVYGKSGGKKRVDTINPSDIIMPCKSPMLFVMPRTLKNKT